MMQLKKLWLGLALMVGVFASGGASATVVCQGCTIASGFPASFLGNFNPSTSDQASFTHTAIGPGSFSDWWIINIVPAGLGTLNAIFAPSFGVSGFEVDLFSIGSASCAPLSGSPPTSASGCSPFAPPGGAPLASDVGGFALNIGLLPLSGFYAFHIIGTSIANGASNLYSGNVTTLAGPPFLVPEPTPLALLGVGLLALGLALRRRA